MATKTVALVAASGGKAVYAGRVASLAARSVSIPFDVQTSMRAVLVTQWASWKAFVDFRRAALKQADSPWALSWSTPFRRPLHVNLPLPVGMYLLRLKAALTRTVHDVHTPNTREEFERVAKKGNEYMYEKIQQMAVKLEDALSPSEPIMIWNWMTEADSEEARAANDRYGLKMMEMLSQNGAGMMDYGITLHPNVTGDDEPWRNFQQVAAVHYPNRRFFVNMVRSHWMQTNVQDKSLGDTLALLTVPLLNCTS